MKRALGITALAIIGLAIVSSGAELEKKAEPPQATTNLFNNWTLGSMTLNLKSPGSDWGTAKRIFVRSADKPAVSRQVLQRLHENLQLQEQRLQREKLLRGMDPALFEQYHVHLSHTPDHSTNSLAN